MTRRKTVAYSTYIYSCCIERR